MSYDFISLSLVLDYHYYYYFYFFWQKLTSKGNSEFEFIVRNEMKFFWGTSKYLLPIISAQTSKNNVPYHGYKVSFLQNEKILEIYCTIRTYTGHLKNVKMINFIWCFFFFTTIKKNGFIQKEV